MPFDWMEPKRPNNAGKGKAEIIRELEQRAALLQRLGYDVGHTTRRCLANLHWDFEGTGDPPISDTDVERLVVARFKSG